MITSALLIAQGLGALLLAGVLGHYWREYRQGYLGWWAASFVTLALYVLIQWLIHQLRVQGLSATDPSMIAAALLYTSLGFLQLLALMVGLALLLSPQWQPGRHPGPILLVSLLLGAAVTLPYATEADGNLSRLFLRTGLRYLLTGLTLLGAALVMLRAQGPRHAGRWLVCLGLAGHGSLLTLMGAMSVPGTRTAGSEALGALARVQPVADLLVYQVIGLGLVIWMLAIERRRAETADRRLQSLSRSDPLTGLANDTGLKHALDDWFARHPSRAGALAIVGLDRFRLVNEALGMHGGDAALGALGERLARRLPDGLHIARLAGDQFLLFTADDGLAPTRFAALQSLIAQRLQVASQTVYLQASVGWSTLRSTDLWELVKREAEIALQEAKRVNPGHCLRFAAPMRGKLHDWVSFSDQVRHAFDENAFALYLQPIFDCREGTVMGYEALARWQHPERGLLGPGTFLPQLQTLRLMPRFDRMIIHRAIELLGSPEGAQVPRLAVNLSPESLDGPDLLEDIRGLLQAHGVDPQRLTVEVTESVAMRSLESGQEVLRHMVELGVRVAVDDFGSGYSSLTYLKDLPARWIKFDRTFIASLTRDSAEQTILEALVPLCRRLGRQVVAEGVETEAQFELVRALGFDAVQGFLFARPEPVDTALAVWARTPPALAS